MAQATAVTNRTARGIETRFKGMERTLTGVGRNLGQLFGVGIGIATFKQLASAIGDTVSSAAQLVDLADKIGITTDALQELRFQAEQQGSSQQALDEALEQFSRRIGLAATGAGQLAKILAANNVELRDAEGNLRPLTELLADYADLVKNAANDQDRAVLATEAFGRAGDEMANVLRGGSQELETFRQRAHDLNQVVGEDGLRALESYDDRLAELRGNWNTAWTEMTRIALELLEKIGQAEHFIIDPILEMLDRLRGGAADAEAAGALAGRLAAGNVPRPGEPAAPAPADDVAARIAQAFAVTKLPSRGREGGTGGRGSGSGRSPEEEFGEDIARIRERTEALRVELDVLGKSVAEQERARAAQDLLNQAKQAGIEITPKLRAEIEAEAEAYAAAVENLEQAAERMDAINELAEEFGGHAIDTVEGLLDRTKTLKESLADVARVLRRMALEALLLGQGPLASLFGMGRSGGGVGGLLGGLLGGLGGGVGEMAGGGGPIPLLAPPGRAGGLGEAAGGGHVIVEVVGGELFDARVARVSGAVTATAITANNRTQPQLMRDAARNRQLR